MTGNWRRLKRTFSARIQLPCLPDSCTSWLRKLVIFYFFFYCIIFRVSNQPVCSRSTVSSVTRLSMQLISLNSIRFATLQMMMKTNWIIVESVNFKNRTIFKCLCWNETSLNLSEFKNALLSISGGRSDSRAQSQSRSSHRRLHWVLQKNG